MVDLSILWTDVCTVYTQTQVLGENHRKTPSEVLLLENEPCRISFSSSPVAQQGVVSKTKQDVKLFLSNRVIIPPGSKAVVTRGSASETYKTSGAPAVYSTHQEVNVEKMAES